MRRAADQHEDEGDPDGREREAQRNGEAAHDGSRGWRFGWRRRTHVGPVPHSDRHAARACAVEGVRSAALTDGPGHMTRGIATSHSDHLLEPAGWEPPAIVPRYRRR